MNNVDHLIKNKDEIHLRPPFPGNKGLTRNHFLHYEEDGSVLLHRRTLDMSLNKGMLGIMKCLAESNDWKDLTRYKIIKGEQRRIIEQNERLYEAASYGKTEIVKYLIGAEVDVSKALYAAAGNNHVECLGFLICHGANIEEEEPRDALLCREL